MTYIYGPIPSRRLGKSLGVDPIPLKTCNWNCVYCQLGRTFPLVNERREWAPPAEIVAQVRRAVESHGAGEIDFISFVGSGEPTLHAGLGWMVRAVKEFTAIPVAVITNGSLIACEDVRSDLAAADVVMPTLSTCDEATFRRVHRPHPDLTLDAMVCGLVEFRSMYPGRLWVEVMLLQGVNDSAPALQGLADLLARIRPDQIHLTLPDRPPAEGWVAPPDDAVLMCATAILGACATVVHPAGNGFDLSGHDSPLEALLAILVRHPMSEEQVERALAHSAPHEAEQVFSRLETCGRARRIERHGMRFWTASEQRFSSDERGSHPFGMTVQPAERPA